MMEATGTSSKYILTTNPPLPSTCTGCNRSANGYIQFVDLQQSVDYYGAILLCKDCAREILTVIGFQPTSRVLELTRQVNAFRDKVATQEEELNELRNAVRVVGNYAARSVDDAGITSEASTETSVVDDASESNAVPELATPDEPNSKRRSKNIPEPNPAGTSGKFV